MKKIIIVVVVVAIIVLAIGAYFIFFRGGTQTIQPSGQVGQIGSLPSTPTSVASGTFMLPLDYIGSASTIYPSAPTDPKIAIGTSGGTVQVNNFYLSNPQVIEGGDVVIKQNQNYIFTYTPQAGTFWIGIAGNPFATWQTLAEEDFLTTLGISKNDGCKLSVTLGVVYAAGNPLDGQSFPLSFCTGGAFQGK